MSKYKISDVTPNDLIESQRMLARHPKIKDALKKLLRCQHEFSNRWQSYSKDYAKTDEERNMIRKVALHNLEESQRMMYLHIQGKLDWRKKPDQIANEFDFTPEYTRHLSGYIKYQEIISEVIGWDPLIELIVFVIQGRYGCSISGFYDLFRKINKRPRDQWSDIMDRVIRQIQEGKRINYILKYI